MQKIIIFGLLAVVMLSACAAPAANQQVPDEEGSPVITVYKSPT